MRDLTCPTPDRQRPCRSMQTITPIMVVVHLYRSALLGRRPVLLYRLQIAKEVVTPSVIDRRLHQRSTNASFSTIFRQCATTHKSSSVAAMSATQFEHGVQITRQPINAAPPVLWRSSLGTLKSIRSIHTPNKKLRLDERCQSSLGATERIKGRRRCIRLRQSFTR
jgi:hypothetical protein